MSLPAEEEELDGPCEISGKASVDSGVTFGDVSCGTLGDLASELPRNP
jgi:hypothetical protein